MTANALGPRARERILEAAWELVSQRGESGLSMRALADRLHVKAASLYKHVSDRDEIVGALQQRGLVELDAALRAAGPEVESLARAYRAWAEENPAVYELVMSRMLRRDRMDPRVEASATAHIIEVFRGDHAGARAAWAMVHGLVCLELSERFPGDADVEKAWERAVQMARVLVA